VVHGIGFDATGSTSGEVAAVSTTGSVDPIIQRSGTYATPSQTEYAARWPDGGAWTDGIDTHQVFSFDDDEIFIGSASTFSSIEVILTTPADSEVDPEFYYYDTSPAWVQFYPSDATNGFINDGVISWGSAVATHLLNWKSDYDPGGADGSAGYYIKVKRTQDTVVTPPTPTTIKTLDSTLYSWDESGDLAVNTVIVAGTLTVNGDQSGATDHVFDDYDDIELLRKWRNKQALPFAAGDINKMLVDQGKTLVGIPLVAYITGLIMHVTPDSFNKTRFAPVVSAVIALALSIIEAYTTKSMDIGSAIVRGLAVAMGASGAYEIKRNYKKVRTKAVTETETGSTEQ
jgi:hypothetical protein